jgi:hypothetical protein
MTYLQPHASAFSTQFYRLFILGVGALVVVGVLALVGLYNAVVSDAVEQFASARGLVKDRDPRYLEGTSATWALASVSQF